MELRHLVPLPALLAVTLFSGCEPGQAPKPDATLATQAASGRQPECRLTMGWDPWEPYHYRDIGGAVHGLDVELVTAIAREAGCAVSFDQEDWATLLSRLRSGQIDLLSGATRTSRRESFAWFTEPYRAESFRLYVRPADRERMAGDTLEAILDNDVKIGTTLDYVYGAEIQALEDDPRYEGKFVGVAIGEVNFQKLLDYQIDGFLEDSFVAASIIRKKGLDEQIEEHPVELGTGDVHLMLSRQSVDRETVDNLNDALERIKSAGDYDRIIARYLD